MTDAAIVASPQERRPTGETPEHHQYLTFTLSGEFFAIGILNIKEIIEYGQVTPVPMVPEFVRGVINLRGSVLPVIDLASRFAKQAEQITRRTCIVVLEIHGSRGRHDVGVVVDAVNEVLEISDTDIEPPPLFGANISTDFIAGMGKVGGRFVIMLDVNKVLSIDELTVMTEARQQTHHAEATLA